MSETFERELPDSLVIRVDGLLPPDKEDGNRQPARVVLTMPDFVADGLAHLLAEANRAAAIFGAIGISGIDGWRLADALYAAATFGDYRCPDGGLSAPLDAAYADR